MHRSIRLTAVAVIALALCVAAPRRAPGQVTTERGASILVFPKVIADASDDTVIQLANRSETTVEIFCSYIDGVSATWQSLDFTVALGASRPTHWTAARGRAPDASEGSIDVPAAPAGFRGELLCVQVGVDGAPFSGDDLAGEATVVDLTNGTVAAYAAAGLRGAAYFNDEDEFLCIGGQESDHCLVGPEYDGCPAEWILGLPAVGAADPQLHTPLSARLSVAPCSQDLRDATPGMVELQITVFNEMAQQFAGTVSVSRWADLSLADVGDQIFTRGLLGTDFAEARFQPAAASGGFMLVAEATRSIEDTPLAGSAGINLHASGSTEASDLVVLPTGSP